MEKRITECKIVKGRWKNTISVVYDDSSKDDALLEYYPDELYFSEEEFIGFTEEQALAWFHEKDVAYLQDRL